MLPSSTTGKEAETEKTKGVYGHLRPIGPDYMYAQVYKVQEGDLVVATWEHDGVSYPARVKKVNACAFDEHSTVVVQFMADGIMQTTPWAAISIPTVAVRVWRCFYCCFSARSSLIVHRPRCGLCLLQEVSLLGHLERNHYRRPQVSQCRSM